jgi:hypothetical protein
MPIVTWDRTLYLGEEMVRLRYWSCADSADANATSYHPECWLESVDSTATAQWRINWEYDPWPGDRTGPQRWRVVSMGNAAQIPGVVPAPDYRAAERRAGELLMSILEPAQRDMFRRDGAIIVVARSGTRYRLVLGMTGNVMQLGADGEPVQRLCVHPVGVPLPDILVTQKLLLEADEEEFRRRANITDILTGRMIQPAEAQLAPPHRQRRQQQEVA